MDFQQAKNYLEMNLCKLGRLFREQVGEGFYNPSVLYVLGGGRITFKCHYDGCSSEEDAWEHTFNVNTGRFEV